jgi:bla regulator protein BlaR1
MMGEITNHLWQSTVFAAAVALVTLAFRKNRAEVRYWLWLSASIKFLLPFALLLSLGVSLWDKFPAAKTSVPIAASYVSHTMVEFTQPFPETFSTTASSSHTTNWIPIAIFTVWACGFSAIALMRFRGWLRIRAAIRASRPLDIPATIAIRSTASLLEPGVVGFMRPVLLLPEGIANSLTPPQFEAVLAHEQSHVRRRDNLTSAIHMLVEAVFWFHPLVWCIGAKLVEERERACDEAVLARGNEPKVYAEGILNVCKSYFESPLRCVSGVTGSDLKKRIRAILSERVAGDLNLTRKLALAVAATAALALPILIGAIGAPSLRAQSQDAPGAMTEFRYETASIKPTKLGPGNHHGRTTEDEYIQSNITLVGLIRDAYQNDLGPNVDDDRSILGAPNWAQSDSYDFEAKMESSVADALKKLPRGPRRLARQQMLQALIADRFGLKIHFENKDLPVYFLVSGKPGPNLHEAKPGDTYENAYKLPNGSPAGAGFHSDEEGKITGQGVSIPNLAVWLTRQVGRTVVDKTDLAGTYDLKIEWSPEANRPSRSDPSDSGIPAGPDSSGLSIFAAIQQQLGLKLESGKSPLKIIVVDHAGRPSVN